VAGWCDGAEQSYLQLFDRACRLANALAARGLRPGDRVAVLGPNGLRTVEQVAGIALGSFVRSALYAHQAADVNSYLLELVDARALIVHESLTEGLLAGAEHEYTRERVGAVKKVTSVQFVTELPKSPLGKVLRRAVRDRYWTESGPRIGGA
jgi:acyl-coenzyme A synthetase/AMP-(fatty) acid ligase